MMKTAVFSVMVAGLLLVSAAAQAQYRDGKGQEETPKTDHHWKNPQSCNSLVKCENCDALHDPMHSAPVYGTRTMEPTADRAGLRTNYCQWCRENFHEIWGNTGDYMLYVIQFKAAQYAESLVFTYKEAFPQAPYKEYEYTEFYS